MSSASEVGYLAHKGLELVDMLEWYYRQHANVEKYAVAVLSSISTTRALLESLDALEKKRALDETTKSQKYLGILTHVRNLRMIATVLDQYEAWNYRHHSIQRLTKNLEDISLVFDKRGVPEDGKLAVPEDTVSMPSRLNLMIIFFEYLGITPLDFSLFSLRGIWEEEIPPGHKRVRWENIRGKRLYDDYVEHVAGAAHDLQAYLDGAIRRGQSETEHTTNNALPAPTTPFPRSEAVSGFDSQSADVTDHRFSEDVESGKSASIEHESKLTRAMPRTLHLFVCTSKSSHTTELHQEHVSEISDDRELFQELRRSYHKHRGRFRSYWSLTTVHSIHFMKFAYGGPRYVDVRCHDDLCEPYQLCACIPPKDMVYPHGPDYDCHPIPPRLSPPVGKRLMMDLFTHPESIEPNKRLVIEQLPKSRLGGLNAEYSHEFTHAWGIYFKEGWHWVKIWVFLGVGFFPPSLLFGVIWSVVRDDVQGGFGVAAWWLAGATIVVGILGTRSMTS
ncbi:unnamed protein product [Periconia digitata]|uniref:Uncharacterized protein n=1 Tax=Periconia digitata TaxID=1303443 RepID=A0A9W4U506_9PLEO|nr:unnamed protein product [Periconia digitata]